MFNSAYNCAIVYRLREESEGAYRSLCDFIQGDILIKEMSTSEIIKDLSNFDKLLPEKKWRAIKNLSRFNDSDITSITKELENDFPEAYREFYLYLKVKPKELMAPISKREEKSLNMGYLISRLNETIIGREEEETNKRIQESVADVMEEEMQDRIERMKERIKGTRKEEDDDIVEAEMRHIIKDRIEEEREERVRAEERDSKEAEMKAKFAIILNEINLIYYKLFIELNNPDNEEEAMVLNFALRLEDYYAFSEEERTQLCHELLLFFDSSEEKILEFLRLLLFAEGKIELDINIGEEVQTMISKILAKQATVAEVVEV